MQQHAPATARNREPILEVLRSVFPESGRVLEVGSGTGEHAVFFAEALGLCWQPTDLEPASLSSIDAWRAAHPEANVLKALELDVSRGAAAASFEEPFDAIFSANVIHIAPWQVCVGLFELAGAVLREQGCLVLYGPFKVDGQHTAPSNERFEAWLHERSPAYGVRDLEQVVEAAAQSGLRYIERIAMPANNFCVVFTRSR